MQTKQQVRTNLKQRREMLPKEDLLGRSDKICKRLQEQNFFLQANVIYFYYPLGKEVNLLPLAQKALTLGKQVAFPRVNGSEMEFYQVHSLKEFVEGTFHVMEPTGKDPLHQNDALIFVPGLAFDAKGNRMGYGKGYYDRYFARYPKNLKIGICYAFQVISAVPCDQYDIPMDAIISEEILDFTDSVPTPKLGSL